MNQHNPSVQAAVGEHRGGLPAARRSLAAAILALAVVVATVFPVAATTSTGSAPLPDPAAQPGLSIRLVDPPLDPGDPRSAVYVTGHFAPGDVLDRTVEVTNGEDAPIAVTFGVLPALAEDEWRVGSQLGEGEVAGWTRFSTQRVVVPPGESVRVGVTISIPATTPGGERYAVLVASPDPRVSGSTLVVSRVGIRAYVSVGGDVAPTTDFTIDALQPLREVDGAPAVRVSVTNTGERVIDIAGDLRLDDGPDRLSAGPFEVVVPRTLGPGWSGEVVVALGAGLPDGPWRAVTELTGGSVDRAAEAVITFPSHGAGGSGLGEAVPARPLDRGVLLPVNLVLFLLALAAALWSATRRDRDEPAKETTTGAVV